MSSQPKKISAKGLVADIRNGLKNSEVAAKHGLTEPQLNAMYQQLLDKGLIDADTIADRCPLSGKVEPTNDDKRSPNPQNLSPAARVAYQQKEARNKPPRTEKASPPKQSVALGKAATAMRRAAWQIVWWPLHLVMSFIVAEIVISLILSDVSRFFGLPTSEIPGKHLLAIGLSIGFTVYAYNNKVEKAKAVPFKFRE